MVEESSVKLETERKYNSLENFLELYLSVRSFWFARHLAYEQKLKFKTKKTNGLRKQIKSNTVIINWTIIYWLIVYLLTNYRVIIIYIVIMNDVEGRGGGWFISESGDRAWVLSHS